MKITRALLLTTVLAACSQDQNPSRQFPLSPSFDQGSNVVGQVYTMTNGAAGNAVLAFDRAADGSLTAAGSYPTGGLGTGAPSHIWRPGASRSTIVTTEPLESCWRPEP